MPKSLSPAEQSLVAALRALLRGRKGRVTVGEIVARAEGDGGLGPVLFLLAMPVLLPLPPGVSMVLALPLLVVAPQIIAGRSRLWLPKTLARQSVERTALAKLLPRILPLLERVEALVRPRLKFLTGRVGVRVVGVACTLIAVILILPIPFANLVPALALGFFSLGLTRKDGLLVLVGYSLLALTLAMIALGIHGIAQGVSHLRAML